MEAPNKEIWREWQGVDLKHWWLSIMADSSKTQVRQRWVSDHLWPASLKSPAALHAEIRAVGPPRSVSGQYGPVKKKKKKHQNNQQTPTHTSPTTAEIHMSREWGLNWRHLLLHCCTLSSCTKPGSSHTQLEDLSFIFRVLSVTLC